MRKIQNLKDQLVAKKASKLFSRFLSNMENAAASTSETDVHQLRVSVKKWRALLKLAAFSKVGKKADKFYPRYKKVYQASGELREIQLHIGLIKESPFSKKLIPLLSLLDKQKISCKLRFAYLCQHPQFSYKKAATQKFTALISQINPKSVAQYMTACIKQAQKEMIQCSSDEQKLHDLRKLLKQWHYNTQFLAACGYSFPYTDELITLLTSFGELLGNWQDKDVAIQYLYILSTEKFPLDTATFNSFVEGLTLEKADLLIQINQRILVLSEFLTKIRQ